MRITLVGSAKFEKEFKTWNKRLSLLGHVVYSLACYPSDEGSKDWYTSEEKEMLDKVHRLKIRHSECVVVLNVGGYIGESTRGEIEEAVRENLSLYFLEPIKEAIRVSLPSSGPVFHTLKPPLPLMYTYGLSFLLTSGKVL